ncbi:MAG: YrrS family protein [Lysinibacillus sp.]
MSNKEKEHLDHSKPARRTTRRKQDKMNRLLNYLIGIVSVLIVISLFVIFTGNEEQEAIEGPEEETPVETKPEEEKEKEEEGTSAEEPSQQDEEQEPIEDEPAEGEGSTPVVSSSNQPGVDEVWTSEAWEPYPTAQTGEHTSTFTEGHIDYEEKLNAIYSVIPLEQQDSILWSIKNNGNAKSAIAVISSNDKEQKYRVAIGWVEGEGWMPQQVEVLNTLEGTY